MLPSPNTNNTMKINITKAELLTILTARFGVEVTEFSIAKGTEWEKFVASWAKANSSSVEAIRLSDQKIPAIKSLRTITNYGLAEAKWAVENMPAFERAFKKYGRLPVLNGNIFGPTGPQIS